MNKEEASQLIKSTGALLEGHFVLTSGKHSGIYINKDMVSSVPSVLSSLAKEIAFDFLKRREDVEVIAAPAIGAIPLGNWVAYYISRERGRDVSSIYAEEVNGEFQFDRTYEAFITVGTRVLIVEDVITTGKTIRLMLDLVQRLDGTVVGVGVLWNRSQENLDLEIPLYTLVTRSLPVFDPQNCQLCQEQIRVDIRVGHGQKFLDNYGTDPKKWPANRES